MTEQPNAEELEIAGRDADARPAPRGEALPGERRRQTVGELAAGG